MKQLYTSNNSAELGLLRSRLEEIGIECETRNEAASQDMFGFPFQLELWILNDEDWEDASALIADWRKATETDGTERTNGATNPCP